ncbi:MAG TPA: outer membrane protein assembly factor BamE [Sphingomicrobium sp.]|jgi:outer membrane protein assembly factor BamE (lipoprotein component of BamABCDE complex)
MKLGLTTAILSAAMLLSGCAQFRSHKGVVLEPQLAAAIQPGVDNKDSVEKSIGRPTFVGQFTPNDWYYVSRDENQVAFRNPHVVKETVLIVRFDPKGNVASVQRTGKELVMDINPTHRTTPTLGRKRSFFEDLFGNIGSVGAPGLPTSGGGGGGNPGGQGPQ